MQPSTFVPKLPCRKDLRSGQIQVIEHPNILNGSKVSVKLPTGYGKTLTACCVYSIRQQAGLSTRLLYIVPRTAQLEQFIQDGPSDLAKAGVQGNLKIMDIGFYPLSKLIKEHRQNKAQIFATTIQNLITPTGLNAALTLMESGQWMITPDEYQHYGKAKTWGMTVNRLLHTFLLPMSATPYRPKDDSAFGEPDISISYRQAVEEGAIKPLHGHAYQYRVDIIDDNGEIKSFTTGELINKIGSSDPDVIEKYRVERKMRWSPKYVSPLVRHPVERMESGCQVLISAMCVSHADLICGQIKSMFPSLRVDWVGTGKYGRTDDENKEILKKFCPEKDSFGIRVPLLDVLVHVGLAGEGLDSTHVSEIVFLRQANGNNTDNQIIGRGSRLIPGRKNITCHVNFDNSSTYPSGEAIMDAIDDYNFEEPKKPRNNGDDFDLPALPIEPEIEPFDVELINIDSGIAVKVKENIQIVDNLVSHGLRGIATASELLANINHPDWIIALNFQNMFNVKKAEEYNEKSMIRQYREKVDHAVRTIVGRVISFMAKANVSIEKSLAGDIMKKLNSQKKLECGPISNELEMCKRHYTWLQQVDAEMLRTKKVPLWLSI
jgi:superfamily II DNA or RNA helicase